MQKRRNHRLLGIGSPRGDWDSPDRLKEKFGNARIVSDKRQVFNIKGNNYRLVVRINYPARVDMIVSSALTSTTKP